MSPSSIELRCPKVIVFHFLTIVSMLIICIATAKLLIIANSSWLIAHLRLFNVGLIDHGHRQQILMDCMNSDTVLLPSTLPNPGNNEELRILAIIICRLDEIVKQDDEEIRKFDEKITKNRELRKKLEEEANRIDEKLDKITEERHIYTIELEEINENFDELTEKEEKLIEELKKIEKNDDANEEHEKINEELKKIYEEIQHLREKGLQNLGEQKPFDEAIRQYEEKLRPIREEELRILDDSAQHFEAIESAKQRRQFRQQMWKEFERRLIEEERKRNKYRSCHDQHYRHYGFNED